MSVFDEISGVVFNKEKSFGSETDAWLLWKLIGESVAFFCFTLGYCQFLVILFRTV
jgi:hypothetical protein